MRDPYRGAGSEILNDIYSHTADVLTQYQDYSTQDANETSRAVVNRLREVFGGQLVYFPKGVQDDVTERDERMFNEFDGKNQKELAKKYGLTLQQVYRRLRVMTTIIKGENSD
ncbi:MAG: Mor transcription activator family protein [Candidatus Thiodiazotropha endolucinida]